MATEISDSEPQYDPRGWSNKKGVQIVRTFDSHLPGWPPGEMSRNVFDDGPQEAADDLYEDD